MKYLKQISIILFFTFVGELLNKIIPLPIPTSIYGMLLLFLALVFKIIKLEQVSETADFMFSIMIILFIPASVGVIDVFFQYKPYILPIFLIIITSTFIAMLVTAKTSQVVSNLQCFNKKAQKNSKEKTVLAVILSGLVGAVIAPYVYKIFKIKNSVSQGLGSGTSSHALGTTAALELGEVQAAMSALAINVTGIMTVFIAPIVSNIFFS